MSRELRAFERRMAWRIAWDLAVLTVPLVVIPLVLIAAVYYLAA